MKHSNVYDVVIAGGGPAGLSAALLLGRSMRKVLVCGSEEDHHRFHPSSCGFIGHDGRPATDYLTVGMLELAKYPSVEYSQTAVVKLDRPSCTYQVVCSDGSVCVSRAVLLAPDFVAEVPAIRGAEECFGITLHQCPPYGDGWDHRNQRIGVLGSDATSFALARRLRRWSNDVTLYTHGATPFSSPFNVGRGTNDLPIRVEEVKELISNGGILTGIRMASGAVHPCDAMFYATTAQVPALATRMGWEMGATQGLFPGRHDGDTGIQGLFIAGGSFKSAEFAILASADGIRVAGEINDWLEEAGRSYLGQAAVSL